ncbi:hypothetical protein TNCV_3495771 [Trichonephila clavipes]|nr:hypothetical protein TNCV_3495771 [Trichonephila clavipes]
MACYSNVFRNGRMKEMTFVEQRMNIKFCRVLRRLTKCTAVIYYREPKILSGIDVQSRETIENDERSRRPQTSHTTENIGKVSAAVRQNRHQTLTGVIHYQIDKLAGCVGGTEMTQNRIGMKGRKCSVQNYDQKSSGRADRGAVWNCIVLEYSSHITYPPPNSSRDSRRRKSPRMINPVIWMAE